MKRGVDSKIKVWRVELVKQKDPTPIAYPITYKRSARIFIAQSFEELKWELFDKEWAKVVSAGKYLKGISIDSTWRGYWEIYKVIEKR